MDEFTLTDTNKHLLPSKIHTITIKTKDYGDLRNIQVDKIIISGLKISELNNLPQALEILDCSFNKIINLNNLPQTLKSLYCRDNQITNLDKH